MSIFLRSLIIIAIMMVGYSSVQAFVVGGWDFEDSDLIIDTTSPNNMTNELVSSSGNSVTFPGGQGSAFAAAWDDLADQNSSYIEIPLDTTGCYGIVLEYSGSASSAASKYWKIQYSVYGSIGPFVDFGPVIEQNSTVWTVSNTFDFSSIEDLNDNSSAVFRIVATDSNGDGTGTWINASSSGDPDSTGIFSLDDVSITTADKIWAGIQDECYREGDTLIIPIFIHNPDTAVMAFGFDVIYDTSQLSYSSCSAGDLTSGWKENFLLGCNEITAGDVTVGGWNTPGIPVGSNGSIVLLSFDVLPGNLGDTSAIHLESFTDSIVGWASEDTAFYYGCEIEVSDTTACAGSVEVSISVNTGGAVDFFAFSVHYNTSMLMYTDVFSPGELTADWALLSCFEMSSGELLVVGTSNYGGTPLSGGTVGSILVMNYNVACSGCTEGQTSAITISDLDEDFLNYLALDGSFQYSCAGVPDSLVVGSASGSMDDIISIPVTVDTAPNDVDEFGFDLHYCSDMLIFTGFSPGILTSDWTYLDCFDDLVSQTITIGGYEANPSYVIPAGTSGTLIVLDFRVTCGSCLPMDTCTISADDFVSDVLTWDSSDGQFIFVDPTPSVTPNAVPATGPAGIGILITMMSTLLVVFFSGRGR